MRLWTKPARWHRGEEGSALVIALFFVVVFSLFVASVISFAEVGLRASRSFGDQGRDAFATDGAVNAAINRFRQGGPCDNYTAPLGPDGKPLHRRGVIVRCVDDERPAGGSATRPVNALLSLGPEGISTSGEQRIVGNIFSNSTVHAGGTLIVQGLVSATGDCNPVSSIQTSPDPDGVRCSNTGGGADVSQGRDPDYTKARSTVPVRRVPPPCPEEGWLVEIEPGYYDDAAGLNALTNRGDCAGKVVWLKPGDYYLDFTFRGGGADTWTINDANVVVVAGAPRGWDPAAPARPAISVPGSCRTVDGPGAVDGVQLIAGGATHLLITKGLFELCAESTPADQSIALYGIAPDRPVHTLEPTDWAEVNRFTNPGNATVIGETPPAPAPSPATATASLTEGATNRSASLKLTAFRPPVPAGSLIDSATLRVVHREDGDLDDNSVKVAAAFAGSTCAGVFARAVPASLGALAEHRIDLRKDCGLNDATAFADLAVTYTAALEDGGSTGEAILDGIAVEVAYRAPRTGKPTVVTGMTGAGFTNPANALEIGDQPAPLTADTALDSVGPTTASITLGGLGDPPIAAGSTIDSAVLRVAHREQGATTVPTPSVTVSFPGGACNALPLTASADVIADDRVDLKACGLDDAVDLPGLTATYAVSLAGGGGTATASLDGMWLELVYRPPPSGSPATVTPGPTPTSFDNADNAKVVGESPFPRTADATLSSAGPTSASLTLAGYAQPAVPVGSIIDSAVLRVVHQDLGPMDTPGLTATFPGIGPCSPVLTKRPAALGEDRVDLKACGLTDPAALARLSVTYTVNLTAGATTPPNATARVDGLVLELVYRPPAIRQPMTASTTTPGFANPGDARVIGESPTPRTADVTLANGATAASVTVAGYDSDVPLPAGSVIDSAVLRVAHQDDPWMGPLTVAAAFDGTTCPGPTALPLHPGAIGVQRVDLATCGLIKAEQLAGLAATYTANPPATTTATQVPAAAASTTFADPDNAKAIGEQPTPLVATAILDGATAPIASITLSDYDQPVVPAGSTISAAVLRFAHQEDAGAASSATVSFTDGACDPQSFPHRFTMAEDTIDLFACGMNDPAQLEGLTVTYDASLSAGATNGTALLDGVVLELSYQAPSGTTRLDGIELDIVFRPPTFRPLDGCLTNGTYPAYPDPLPDPAMACALVKVAPAGDDTTTRFAAQGTIYAPTAALDISMNGLEDQVLTRGLLARTIRLGLKAHSAYKRPLMGVPPEPVKFTAYPDVTARPETAASSGFASPGNAKAVDGATADAALDSTGPTSATITLDAFTQDGLPPGSPIEVAVLRVVHRADIGIGSVTVTVGGAGSCAANPKTFPLPVHASSPATPGPLTDDQIDLTKGCGLTTADLTGLTVTYSVALTVPDPPATTTATAYLDGITVDLLSRPLLRARVAFDATRDSVDVQGWSVLR